MFRVTLDGAFYQPETNKMREKYNRQTQKKKKMTTERKRWGGVMYREKGPINSVTSS